MARPKKSDQTTASSVDDLALSLQDTLSAHATSSRALLQGDLAVKTWGVPIPALAFQWLIGGSNVLPAQRYITVSGLPKSFKSTLSIEFGNWFIMDGGLHVQVDTESKTSPTMLDSMTWKYPNALVSGGKRRLYKPVQSIDEWQKQVVELVDFAKANASRPKGSRVPILCTIDSLSGTTTEGKIEALMDEGAAKERDFPVEAMKISRFLSALKLTDTTMNVSAVQHLMQDLSADASYGGPKFREKGAMAMRFGTSVNMRVVKGQGVRMASHEGAPMQGPPVEGYTLYITTECSCVGPDGNRLAVDILWQYIEDEAGNERQVMWYDWEGALGRMLRDCKYSDKVKLYEYEKEQLDKAVYFTQPKANRINCEALGLKEASLYQFGKAIQDNPEVRARVSKYLKIAQFPEIQQADIELGSHD